MSSSFKIIIGYRVHTGTHTHTHMLQNPCSVAHKSACRTDHLVLDNLSEGSSLEKIGIQSLFIQEWGHVKCPYYMLVSQLVSSLCRSLLGNHIVEFHRYSFPVMSKRHYLEGCPYYYPLAFFVSSSTNFPEPCMQWLHCRSIN